MKTVVVLGASGYVGRALTQSLSDCEKFKVKVFRRKDSQLNTRGMAVEVGVGDLLDPSALIGFIDPGCTVVNLAFNHNATMEVNLKMAQNIVDACVAARIERLIHVSTAVVSGRTNELVVTERSKCRPKSVYAHTKLKIEELISSSRSGQYEVVVLRPTAIFGPGGKALKKLAKDLLLGNSFVNYLRSSLFGFRKMHLVHIQNVISAVEYLINAEPGCCSGVYIVSDDEDSANNFRSVEGAMSHALGIKEYRTRRIPFPRWLLSAMLLLPGKDSIDPRVVYSSKKLMGIGYRKPLSFSAGLSDFIKHDPIFESSRTTQDENS